MSKRYFYTKKWVFDPAARRLSRRASGILSDAIEAIHRTDDPTLRDEGDFCERTTFDAEVILTAALKRVAAAEDAAHKAAAS